MSEAISIFSYILTCIFIGILSISIVSLLYRHTNFIIIIERIPLMKLSLPAIIERLNQLYPVIDYNVENDENIIQSILFANPRQMLPVLSVGAAWLSS